MITIKSTDFIRFADDNRTSVIRAEIFADTVEELPKTDDFDDFELVQGSTAYVITTGKFYVLSGSGEWYCSEET